MRLVMKRYLCALWAVLLIASLMLPAAAIVDASGNGEVNITKKVVYSIDAGLLTDDRESTRVTFEAGSRIDIEYDFLIAALYIKFDRTPSVWTLCVGEQSVECGKYGFLHEYCDIDELFGEARSVGLCFSEETTISDIYVFSAGELPDWVQIWEPAEGDADLLLISTHADDEQLFFLGLLPYYAGELQYEVQVAYFTNHLQTRNRPHELLNGLWTVGVRRYPVISDLPDGWNGVKGDTDSAYYSARKAGFERDDLIAFQVGLLRRFKPQVVVGHDINGEYGHPQHMINTETLIAALPLAADAEYTTNDVEHYGAWDVPKVYLHLYGENQISMNWDIPLSRFGGMTAYEVSRLGYACHLSQQYTWFTDWMLGSRGQYTKATDIGTYKPTEYGLYKSTVGIDVTGGDFFEHLTVRSQIPVTEPMTEPVTEPVTEPATKPVTEPETAAFTETEELTTEKEEPVDTSGVSISETAYETTGESLKPNDGGGVSMFVVVAAVAAAAAIAVPASFAAVREKSKRK